MLQRTGTSGETMSYIKYLNTRLVGTLAYQRATIAQAWTQAFRRATLTLEKRMNSKGSQITELRYEIDLNIYHSK